jgi:hypothetical protein
MIKWASLAEDEPELFLTEIHLEELNKFTCVYPVPVYLIGYEKLALDCPDPGSELIL